MRMTKSLFTPTFLPLVGFLLALILGAWAAVGRAEDPCRANCDAWLAACLRACADAPVVAECKANCRIADRKCMDDCDDG